MGICRCWENYFFYSTERANTVLPETRKNLHNNGYHQQMMSAVEQNTFQVSVIFRISAANSLFAEDIFIFSKLHRGFSLGNGDLMCLMACYFECFDFRLSVLSFS